MPVLLCQATGLAQSDHGIDSSESDMALILLNQTFTPTESGIILLYSLRAMAPTQDEMSDSR